jgi:hypothetical protein
MFNIFSHQENANQTTLRFHLTPVRMAKIKKKKKKKKPSCNSSCGQGCGENQIHEHVNITD